MSISMETYIIWDTWEDKQWYANHKGTWEKPGFAKNALLGQTNSAYQRKLYYSKADCAALLEAKKDIFKAQTRYKCYQCTIMKLQEV